MNELAKPIQTSIQKASVNNPIAAILSAVVEKGITAESVAAVERLCDLYTRMENDNARKDFIAAKAKMQAELPKIVAKRTITDAQNRIRAIWAKHEDIMHAISPVLEENGFSIGFSQPDKQEDGKTTAVMTLSHIGGHSETSQFTVRNGKGPPGCSDAQADGSGMTYAMRYALCAALNLEISKSDEDARILGDYISPDQAKSLESRVVAVGANIDQFLKFADAPSFKEIREGKYAVIDKFLTQKERMSLGKKSPSVPSEIPISPELVATYKDFVDACRNSATARGASPAEVNSGISKWMEDREFSKISVEARANVVAAIRNKEFDFQNGKIV